MLIQSDEYFIEAVSNASMDLFPNNTLSKFTNRLSRSIELNEEWYVAVQKIFYPTDIYMPDRKLEISLIQEDDVNLSSFTLPIQSGSDINFIIHQINAE